MDRTSILRILLNLAIAFTSVTEEIIPDTSVLLEGKISDLAEEGNLDGEVVIPELVVDEIESQANKGMEIGKRGIQEITNIRKLADQGKIDISFTGRKPTEEEIMLAENGRIDALIRDIAEDKTATLYTADRVQSEIARAKGVDVKFFDFNDGVDFPVKDFFDEKTMSVHLKEGSIPEAKKGEPGDFQLKKIADEKMERGRIEDIIDRTIEKAEVSEEGLVEMEGQGATVVQINDYRVAIARPPFSEKSEVTAVKPVADIDIEDYGLSDKLMKRLDEQAEGVLIAGAPGHGKSTFAQALSEYYRDNGYIMKTMEKPRDLDVGDDITQYSALDSEMANTGDFLLLVRPDFTVYDEVRKTSDFEVYTDMRMAGVGMLGVVHASEAVDAIQRLIGRVELGMIPQVCDTVIHLENAEISRVYKLGLTVKVPEGMTEADLARPVVQVRNLEDGKPEYEIYTYGEETVVIPVENDENNSRMRDLAEEQLRYMLDDRLSSPEIEFITDDHIRLLVDENEIPEVIGKGGKNIDRMEEDLDLDITVEPKKKTLKSPVEFDLVERGNSIVLEVGEDRSGSTVDLYAGDEFLFNATVGQEGEVSLTKSSEQAGRILSASESGILELRI